MYANKHSYFFVRSKVTFFKYLYIRKWYMKNNSAKFYLQIQSMFLLSDEYTITYPQHSFKGDGWFRMRLFAILFVYNNIHVYNISNIINEFINGCERINVVNDVSLMQFIRLFRKFYGTLFQIPSSWPISIKYLDGISFNRWKIADNKSGCIYVVSL